MKPLIREIDNKYIEVIGHYDDQVLCAKMTVIADLFAIEKKEGYAKFKVEDADKLSAIDKNLKFSVSDLTGTTWVLKSDLSELTGVISASINFSSNNGTFSSISATYDSEDGWYYLRYGSTLAGTSYEWENEAYRTITITGGSDVTNASLIAWLEANAVQQTPTQPDLAFIGSRAIVGAFVGNKEVQAIYLGNNKIYNK